MERHATRPREVRKPFGHTAAVAGVDLGIGDGEFFSLLGPSGSGGTTLLRLIARFEQPDEGRIELAGRDVTDLAPFAREVHTVFQDYALFPHMTVEQSVAYGLRVREAARAERVRRTGEALAAVRLADHGRRRPAQLSGGQRSTSRSPAPSSADRGCCSWTNRSAFGTVLQPLGVGLGLFTVVGHATFCVVVVFDNVAARLRRTTASQEAAAMDLGAHTFRAFLDVTFPQLRLALPAGPLLAFALSFDEIVVTTFTAGPGVRTLPLWIYDNMTRPQQAPVVSVVAAVLVLLSVLPVHAARRLSAGTSTASRI